MEIFYMLIVSLLLTGAPIKSQDGFAFTAKKWEHFSRQRIYVTVKDSLIISCQTNDKNASTTLMYRSYDNAEYKDAVNKLKNRLIPQGQNYSVTQIEKTDIGIYKCTAKNQNKEIELILGKLFVDPIPKVYTPELYPSVSKYKIEANGNENITCKAHGAVGDKNSYLNWYKENNGDKTLVDNSMIFRTEEILNSKHVDVEILMFKKFAEIESGLFICVRKVGDNAATEASIEIQLQPNASPKLRFENSIGDSLSMKPGESKTITCVIEGSPTPKKHWEKNGVVIRNCPETTNPRCSLALQQVEYPDDDGEYLCVGENVVKKVTKSLTVEVQVPPVLRKPTQIIEARPNEDREILCELKSGNPFPTFVWEEQPDTCEKSTQECKPIEKDWETVDMQYPSLAVPTNKSYIISSKAVNYFYRCSISNIVGKDLHTIKLLRNEKAPAQFQFNASRTDVNEDEKLVLQCVADIHVYKSTEVFKDGIKISAQTNRTSRTIILTYTVQSLKTTDSAEYVCKAIRKRGGEKEISVLITVKELKSPEINGFDDITTSQDAVRNFNMSCDAKGNPAPSVIWKHNNKPLQSNDISNIDRCDIMNPGIYHLRGVDNVLVFCSLNFSLHGGDYECFAKNKVGEDSKKMKLQINAMPRIIGWRNTTTFAVGSPKKLACLTEANPPANVTWFHKSENSSSLVSGIEKSIMIFDSVKRYDSGKYQCIAWNEFGEISKTLHVQIVGEVVSVRMSPEKKESTIYGIVIAFVAILILVFILVFLYRRHLKKKYALYLEPNENFMLDHNRSLFEQSSELPYDFAWEFPRERVNFVKTLGSGAFGQVWLAEADGIKGFKPRDPSSDARKRRKAIQKSRRYHMIKHKQTNDFENSGKDMVAIKTLKEDAAEGEYKDLASELKILIHLGEHKNIVNLLGACTTGGKLFVILECCSYGNLLNFLREKREVFRPYWLKIDNDIDKEFTYVDLISIGYQISQGMDFLQSKKCVHRDLAARNILVGEGYLMKIADFGLARDIYKDEFYLKQTTSLLPVKWMAPESLFDKVYTSSSDVWSFGILLWEVFTLGGSPYPGLPTEELFNYLQDGKRMERTDLCPIDVYEIMLNCWEKSPYKRPLFAQIGEKFRNVIQKNSPEDSQYLDLIPSNGHYMNPPSNTRASRTSLNSAEYIDSVGNGGVLSSTKGETYVPPPLTLGNGSIKDNPLQTETTTPLLSPLTEDEYIPMTPADHYQNPRRFTYGQEAMV